MHPRQQEIEAARRMKPIGQNCAVNLLRNGSRHVLAHPGADPEGAGTHSDPPYFGEYPFTVTRGNNQPDVVTCSLKGDDPVQATGSRYWEITAPSTALFTQDPAIVDIDPADLPMGIEFTTTFSVFFVDWADAPPFFPVDNPLYQLATVQPFYVIERWRDMAYAADVGTGTIIPVLNAWVDVTWTDTLTIPPDSVDPTGTYPNDSFKIRLYTDNTRAVEMLVVNSA